MLVYQHVAVLCCVVLCWVGCSPWRQCCCYTPVVRCETNPVVLTHGSILTTGAHSLLLQQHQLQSLHTALPACFPCFRGLFRHTLASFKLPPHTVLFSSNTPLPAASVFQPVIPGRAPLSANSRPNTTKDASTVRKEMPSTAPSSPEGPAGRPEPVLTFV